MTGKLDYTSSCLVLAAALDPRILDSNSSIKFLNELPIQAVTSEITERMDSFSSPDDPSCTSTTGEPLVKKYKTALGMLLEEDNTSSSRMGTMKELNQHGKVLAPKGLKRERSRVKKAYLCTCTMGMSAPSLHRDSLR